MHAWYMPHDLCDDLINFHTQSPNKCEGKAGNRINKNIKASTDTSIPFDHILFHDYSDELQKGVNRYIEKYPMVDQCGGFTNLFEPTQIQKYEVGEGFFTTHTERDAQFCERYIVYMTYLNDVPNGGTTWPYIELTLPAEKGLTVLWSADYVYAHRGCTENVKDVKYICTGWFNLRTDNKK